MNTEITSLTYQQEKGAVTSTTRIINLVRQGSLYRWKRDDGQWVSPIFTSIFSAISFVDFRSDADHQRSILVSEHLKIIDTITKIQEVDSVFNQ